MMASPDPTVSGAGEQLAAALSARAGVHALEPGSEARQRVIEGLIHTVSEIEPDVEPDIGHREALSAQVGAVAEHAVEPSGSVAGDPLQPVRRLRRHRYAVFEPLQRPSA